MKMEDLPIQVGDFIGQSEITDDVQCIERSPPQRLILETKYRNEMLEGTNLWIDFFI